MTKPGGSVSWMATSKAPFGLWPWLSTTMANFTRSPAWACTRLALTGLAARVVLLMAPVKPLPPGAAKLAPAGPTPAVKTAPASLLATTPLVMASLGSPRVNWMMALDWLGASWLLVSPEVTWLVSNSPSPKGASPTLTVKNRSRWLPM